MQPQNIPYEGSRGTYIKRKKGTYLQAEAKGGIALRGNRLVKRSVSETPFALLHTAKWIIASTEDLNCDLVFDISACPRFAIFTAKLA